ncbi:hypothetical protein HK102_008329 [Quaeritorhiza haematococci]|nr:hypothetical protein HK102_008329 [Quaeritorhiza haematococci]
MNETDLVRWFLAPVEEHDDRRQDRLGDENQEDDQEYIMEDLKPPPPPVPHAHVPFLSINDDPDEAVKWEILLEDHYYRHLHDQRAEFDETLSDPLTPDLLVFNDPGRHGAQSAHGAVQGLASKREGAGPSIIRCLPNGHPYHNQHPIYPPPTAPSTS